MENDKSSMTAMITSFGRAYHAMNDQPLIFDDFLARKLISDEQFTQMSGYLADGINYFNPEHANDFTNPAEALKWVVQTQIAPITLARTRYCEDMLLNEINLGVKQYVILGAGMDTFSFRYPELLKKINVYEMDHPSTQAYKIDKIKALGWEIPDNLHFIPVDFTKDNFIEVMERSAFDTTVKSFFSWLGVTYYLGKENITQMLEAVVSLAPEGSAIVFDYGDEYLFDKNKSSGRVQKMVAMAAASGEPMKACFSYYELENTLQKAGLLIYEHLTPAEIEQRYFKNRNDHYHAFENTNIVLAVKK